jgi:hypothetical protein
MTTAERWIEGGKIPADVTVDIASSLEKGPDRLWWFAIST